MVCSESVRSEASVMVSEIIIGSLTFSVLNFVFIVNIVVLALRVSKTVLIRIRFALFFISVLVDFR